MESACRNRNPLNDRDGRAVSLSTSPDRHCAALEWTRCMYTQQFATSAGEKTVLAFAVAKTVLTVQHWLRIALQGEADRLTTKCQGRMQRGFEGVHQIQLGSGGRCEPPSGVRPGRF